MDESQGLTIPESNTEDLVSLIESVLFANGKRESFLWLLETFSKLKVRIKLRFLQKI